MTTTSDSTVDALSYPIGRFVVPTTISAADRARYIEEIAAAPAALRAAVKGMSESKLNTEYRPGGWTVRQVVHHVPDSHLNAYIRMKLALTEDEPVIKPYDEARWAELADVPATPIETSLTLLECLHRRWVLLLRALGPKELSRRFRHPEHNRSIGLEEMLALYAWHGRHHVAHITSLRSRMGWE